MQLSLISLALTKVYGGVAAFSPSSLFASGEQGAWYDPSDLTTMFQDSAGTTPVTAVGQNVRVIQDKSGNGNHIVFNGNVPLAQDAAGKYYLQGNGATGLTASAVDMSAFDKMTISVAHTQANAAGCAVLSFGNVSADAGSFELGGQSAKKPLLYWRGTGGFCGKYYAVDITDKLVFTTQIDFAGTDQATESPLFQINGSDVATTQVNTSSGNGPLGAFQIKLMSGFQPTSIGRFYGAIAVSKICSADEITNINSYLGNKAGVVVDQPVLPYSLTPTQFTDSLTPISRTDYLETSAYGSVVFDTTATEIEVVAYCNIASLSPDVAEIGVVNDGVFHSTVQQGGDGENRSRVTLPSGAKRVTLSNGAQTQLAPIKGTFITSVNANAAMTQVFPTATNRLVCYGDSLTVGANAHQTQQNAWTMQLRRSRGTDSTVVEAQGYRSLYDDSHDSTTRAAFVSKISGLSPAKLWMAIGTNDYGIPKWSAASFGAEYALVLDALIAAMPSLIIYCQTPIERTSEAANSYGNTLQQYRDQIATVVNTRTAFCTLVDGTAILDVADLDDGVHPTDAGQTKYFDFVDAISL